MVEMNYVIGGLAGVFLLPASVRAAVEAVPARRSHNDGTCRTPGCGSALFVRVDIVRAARGYPAGQKRGDLLACILCGAPLNARELEEMARDNSAVA